MGLEDANGFCEGRSTHYLTTSMLHCQGISLRGEQYFHWDIAHCKLSVIIRDLYKLARVETKVSQSDNVPWSSLLLITCLGNHSSTRLQSFKMKASLLFVCLLVLGAECAQQIILQPENPDHPRQCYNEWEKKFYKVGETMKRKETDCVKRVCSGLVEDTKMQITESSCGFVKAEGQCQRFHGDLKKNYPECCPYVKCPGSG